MVPVSYTHLDVYKRQRYTIVVLQDGAVHTAYSGAAIFAQVCNALEAAG